MSNTVTVNEAAILRQKLEFSLLMLLREYQDITGLAPVSVDLEISDIIQLGRNKRTIDLVAVRVEVKL